jgi:hypothetical protein
MKLIYLFFLVIIVIIFILNVKEGMCTLNDSDKETMLKHVQTYPKTYSVDPLYESKFKPECCPNLYTSSSGCLCIDKENYSLIHTRGGNHYDFDYGSHKTPFPSEFKDTCS